ncbi:hypothetical protein RB653_001743 [Dictyostelium firmibasis]|uniref:Uncharacterized protein n=1 Tax=Dictyostelium firmibasis TaxID=79012 RepID=A0AAN7YWW2_9MYCE
MNSIIIFLIFFFLNVGLSGGMNDGNQKHNNGDQNQNYLNLLAVVADNYVPNQRFHPYRHLNNIPYPAPTHPIVTNQVQFENVQLLVPTQPTTSRVPVANVGGDDDDDDEDDVEVEVEVDIDVSEDEVPTRTVNDNLNRFFCRHQGCANNTDVDRGFKKSIYRNKHEKRLHPINNDHTVECSVCLYYSIPSNRNLQRGYDTNPPRQQITPPVVVNENGVDGIRQRKACIHTGCNVVVSYKNFAKHVPPVFSIDKFILK